MVRGHLAARVVVTCTMYCRNPFLHQGVVSASRVVSSYHAMLAIRRPVSHLPDQVHRAVQE
jgi:hypothetical protein